MENDFNNRDFEQFVKQNADQYRMFPSEKVWKSIHHSLHTRKRWYGIGLALLLLTAGTVTWVMVAPDKKTSITTNLPVAQNSIAKTETPSPKVFITAGPETRKTTHFISSAENLQNRIFSNDRTNEPANNEDMGSIALEKAIGPVVSDKPEQPVLIAKTNAITIRQPVSSRPAMLVPAKETQKDLIVVAENRKAEPTAAIEKETKKEKDLYPLTIESVVNSFIHPRAKKKLSWEVYFSPTISYRKLTENKDFINSAQANNNTAPNYYTALSDINSLVTHKPDLGLQLGFTAGYPLSKSLKIIAGMQFNVSKYDILAYTYSSEVATVSLNTGTGANSVVSTFTNYRNFDGNNAGWLHNLYFSASLPVGLDLKLGGASRTKVGVAATIQPTYILGDRAYLISTDYKNYVEIPSLTRKWNISGGLEAYASLSTGKIQWKVGPQVRYQMLSSFKEKYPVKEHLFDFGLKIGVMLKNR